MKLITLGGLELKGSSFRYYTPLVLLTYLSLEGKQSRDHLAELFWQHEGKVFTRRQLLNNLSRALSNLRKHAPEIIQSDQTLVWSLAETDVAGFQRALRAKNYAHAVDAYTGTFLEGHLSGWSVELEEWIFRQREQLAEQAQGVCLALAEQTAPWCPEDAVQHARAALRLAEPQEELLPRFYTLFAGRDSALAREVQDLARGSGVTLHGAVKEPVNQTETSAHNLPTKGTSFVGRDVELGDVIQQLEQPSCRLLNLVGIGGVGKSRLAIQAAYELLGRQFHNGIYYVALDALTSEALISSSIADELSLNLTGQGDELDQLAHYLGDKHLLLILDNFEHLTGGAGFLPGLLEDCPNLKILVTSRERLQLEEEWVLPVEGLALPGEAVPAEEAQYSDAVQLFIQRAYQAQLTFALTPADLPHVLKLCQLVAGSPLALELAAVWAKMLPPEALAQEIEHNLDVLNASTRNRTERHKSLRAVFEHSWNLLSAQEQEVLKKSSVFVGGFTKEAAFEVTGASLSVLASLVNKSLLRVLPSGRYDRHPLIYQYTQEKLVTHPAEYKRLQEQHFSYFLALAEQSYPLLNGSEQGVWLERLEQDHDNFRMALTYALSCDSPEKAMRLAGKLSWFWYIRGYSKEGRDWLKKALSQSGDLSTQARAQALKGAGFLAAQQSDYMAAKNYSNESLAIYQNFDQPEEISSLLNNLGSISYSLGDYRESTNYFEKALIIHEKLGDKMRLGAGLANLLANLGNLAFEQGLLEKARTLSQKSLQILREIGDKKQVAGVLLDLGIIEREIGNYSSAYALINQSLVISREIGYKQYIAYAFENIGTLARREGKYSQARNTYARSLLLWQELGDQANIATALEDFAHLSIGRREWKRAACLLEAAASTRQAINVSRLPSDQPEFEQACNQLTVQLTEDARASAKNEGRAMNLEQAVNYALSVEAV